ncbi:hypothetical protein [Actinomadura sp. 7K507]|uniref:hypothetical protein n=1 Tax=Actinomadura sp. 7K507 TaxID=2530365 RepID=UPI001049B3DA|nr:hypothetical protein [Actinomadura sp. 7K507]TDC76825.1 hypothetical protein E1285_39515 [Actinomadura sp. 7K507]
MSADQDEPSPTASSQPPPPRDPAAASGKGEPARPDVRVAGGTVPPRETPPQGTAVPPNGPVAPGVPGQGPSGGPVPPGGPVMPGAAGRQVRSRKEQLLLIASGAAAVVLTASAVAAVVITGDDEAPEKRAEATVAAAPPAWTVAAGRRLTSGTGLRYDGSMSVGGKPVQAHLRLSPSGLATGTLTAGALKADVVAIGGDTYIKAGPAFWRDYVPEVPNGGYYAGRWSKAPKSVPGFDVPDVLGPEAIARLLAKAPADPPEENVNGVPAYRIKTRGAEYLMTAAAPHRLLSVHAGGPNAPLFTAAPVAAPATLFAELRPRVAGLGGATDPAVRFSPGSLTFSSCDQNPNGCTVSVPATMSVPRDTVPDGARAQLRATITSEGERLGSCTASKTVPANRALVLRCTVTSKRWRNWMRSALDNPGSYPYGATAHVVGEAVPEDEVEKLLARVDRERAAVVKPAPTTPSTPGPAEPGPSEPGPSESQEPSGRPEVATSQTPGRP